jgi:glycoprotein endo-alpha-1,2-mannosidase
VLFRYCGTAFAGQREIDYPLNTNYANREFLFISRRWARVVGTCILIGLWPLVAQSGETSRQILAFYYGWYGNPSVSGAWRHWTNVDPTNHEIANAAHFPALGAYDSHDPSVVGQQVAMAKGAGITGFIASWWGRDSFEDKSLQLLLVTAQREELKVSAYYEEIKGSDDAGRKRSAVSDLEYLLKTYGNNPVWLRVNGKPVIFIYGRALHALSPVGWEDVLQQIRRDYLRGAEFIPDSEAPEFVSVFDGSSNYNITSQTQQKSPRNIQAWADKNFVKMAAAAQRKISMLTVIPGYDDRKVGRAAPRPVTNRWNGQTYKVLWQAAIAVHPDWVLITSWNEWHEGSEIEPSVEYGDQFLDETKVFASQFLGR